MVRSIIHAGGQSTRIKNAFDGPKALAPIDGYPLVWFHMQPFLKSRLVSEYVFTLRHQHEVVQEYIDRMKEKFDVKSHSIIEPRPLGRAGSIRLGIEQEKIDTDSPYIMSHPDDLIPVNIKELMDYAYNVRRRGKSLVVVMSKNTTSPFGIGVVKQIGSMWELKHFKEKPELPMIEGHYANTGMTLYLPEAMRDFKNAPLDRLTHPEEEIIPNLVKKGKVAVFLVDRWISVNHGSEYKKVREMGQEKLLEFLDV
jgi:NDP-sugar pyrophosphorylase family protein